MGWKYNPFTGELDYFEEGGAGSTTIGTPDDGTYEDGLLNLTPSTKIPNAFDAINEILKYLAPPPPQPLSGDLNYTITFKSGIIAQHPNDGGLAGTLHNRITNTTDFQGSTPDPSNRFDKADEGYLRLYKNNVVVDEFDLGSSFDESEREGCQSYPPATSAGGYITVTSVCWHNNFPAYQRGNARVNFNASLLDVGYNRIELSHEIGASIDRTNPQIIYYDDGPAPTINTFNVTLNTEQIKFLSGVKYYALNTSWDVTLAITDVFNKTFVATPASISCPALNTINISWNDSHASGFSNPPNWDDNWTYVNTIQFDRAAAGRDLVFSAVARDPFTTTPATNVTKLKHLFNTYGDISTDKHEYFVDERYRLPDGAYDTIPASITGQWDSTQPLVNGQAQVFCDRLIYPTENFEDGTWRPIQNSGTNYSTFSGDQVYLRAIRDSGTPHNSGSLHIRGITWADVGTNVDLFLKLPSRTGWLDLSRDYNSATFTGADGDGCMTSYSESGGVLTINWTSGTFSTANSGWMYILKIVIKNPSIVIEELWDFGG